MLLDYLLSASTNLCSQIGLFLAWLVTNPKLYFPLGQDIPEPCKKRLEGIFLWQADVSNLSKDFSYGQTYDGVIQVEPNVGYYP